MSQTEESNLLIKPELVENTCCFQWPKVADAAIEALFLIIKQTTNYSTPTSISRA